MKYRALLPLFLIACSGPALQQSTPQPAGGALDAGAASITPNDMHARIAFLASDALRGRDTPSQGLEVAAAYIASEYSRLGLEPRGDSGTYFQRYPYGTRTLLADSAAVSIAAHGQSASLVFGKDFFASAGAPDRFAGDAVFAGQKIDSTNAATLKDKVAVVFVPGAMDRAWRASVTAARNGARTAGASGIIVVLDTSVTEAMVHQRATFGLTTSSVVAPMPVVYVRYDKARDLMAGGATVQAALPVMSHINYPPNVVAVLPGSDPELKNTYVVLSAHMDHIGVTRPDARGDSINNGADDDASGTSAVVETAEAMIASGKRPLRSIMFLNVSGEEKGLLGSQWFSEHPEVPLKSIVADVNIDMIGRNNPDSVVVIGQEYSSLGPLTQRLVKAHPELHLTASKDIWPEQRFFFRSDHFNFARKDIPAIFFFSGVHEDYHKPSDEVQKIDADKAARIARLAYYLTSAIANDRVAPAWTEQGIRDVHALTR